MNNTMCQATLNEIEQETQRLIALEATKLIDSPQSEEFDRITRIAAQMFNVPVAVVSLVTADRQWFKACVGLDILETEREAAFCDHTIRQLDVMVVEDATVDDRFKANRLVTCDGGIRFYAGAPLITRTGHAIGSLCIIDYKPRAFDHQQRQHLADLAKMVMTQVELQQTAGRINEITGLPNRAQLMEDIGALASVGNPGDRALVLVDVMNHANMQSALLALGIVAIEQTMRVIAARLCALVDSKTLVYHASDTRYAFMLQPGERAQHNETIKSILAQMAQPFHMGGVSFDLEMQCGAVTFDAKAGKVGDLVRRATSALAMPGTEGASFQWYCENFDAPHRRTYALLKAVPSGLANGEFRLVYQPKLDLKRQKYTGVEALLRWNHPTFGNVSPAEFIPAVEATNAIHGVTAWVLDTALAQSAAWQLQGVQLNMAVNVSARNLEHPGFLQSVKDACARHAVKPQHLHVECTENAVLTGERSLHVLKELREMGVQISLDDFGIGYSNLSCLQTLPVELLKLDRSLVAPILTDFKAWALAQSLILLGHMLGYRVLAEGVEDEETFNQLTEAGCDAIQGYYLSRPLEASAIPTFIWSKERVLMAA